MKISIITVCYNSAKTIEQCISSVLSQDYENIEYIIIDGGSSDSTMTIVDKLKSNITHIVSEPDKGIYDAMNKGINLASGDYIGLLNSDDFYASTSIISSLVSHIKRGVQKDIYFGKIQFVSSEDENKVTRCYNASKFAPWKLRFGWMPPHPATFISKQAYAKLGPYRIDFSIAADYELFVRAFHIFDMSYEAIPVQMVRMREGGVSTAGLASRLKLNREIVTACNLNGLYTNLLLVLLKIPFKLMELRR